MLGLVVVGQLVLASPKIAKWKIQTDCLIGHENANLDGIVGK
jgi:hypothetical protein